jgi:hypothetical protein
LEIWFEFRAYELCSGANILVTLEGQEEVNWLTLNVATLLERTLGWSHTNFHLANNFLTHFKNSL